MSEVLLPGTAPVYLKVLSLLGDDFEMPAEAEPQPVPVPEPFLTTIEYDFLDLRSRGLSNKQIGGLLGVYKGRDSFSRVRTPMMDKLQARSMSHAVRIAHFLNLFDGETLPVEEGQLKPLTKLQLRDLHMMSLGYTHDEIIELSPGRNTRGAVTHTSRLIRRNLGAKTIPHAVRLALENGYLPNFELEEEFPLEVSLAVSLNATIGSSGIDNSLVLTHAGIRPRLPQR